MQLGNPSKSVIKSSGEAYKVGFFDSVSDNISCPHQKTCNEAEAQDRQSKIRNCLRRIAEVEAINVDLESRLEAQAREYVELESDASESLLHWKAQYSTLVDEASYWKLLHAEQEQKTQKIREQLLRTERELHGILQKKYDIMEFARREERDRIRTEQRPPINTSPPKNNSCRPLIPQSEWMTLINSLLGAPPQDVRSGRSVLALASFFRLGLHGSC